MHKRDNMVVAKLVKNTQEDRGIQCKLSFKKCSLEVTKLVKKHKPFFFAISLSQESHLFKPF